MIKQVHLYYNGRYWWREPLKKILLTKKYSLYEKISIAVKIASIIEEIHSVHIIHKDINPGNIIINEDTGRINLIDFGISTQLSIENLDLKNLA